MEDLLDTEIGKNDYDWLLTPPGTPRVPALDVPVKAPSSSVSKRTVTRSSSTTRASRLSTSEPENGHPTFTTRPARSNSVSRPSIQSTLMSGNNRLSVLNASISSVSSRPTTPSKRTSTLSVSKPSVPSSRPVPTRSSTPSKIRPSTPSKTRPSTPVKNHPAVSGSVISTAAPKITSAPSSRSATPTFRSRIISSSSSSTTSMNRPSSSSGKIPAISRTTSSTSTIPPVSRSSSRSSTPTRQPVKRSSAQSVGRSPSVGRISGSNNLTSNGRLLASSGQNSAPSSAPSSRPSSPHTRSRAPVRPLDIPDFPSETPPNLRTKLPERPLSAGRVQSGMASGVRSTPNVEPFSSAPVKKMSVPAITRSKISDVPSKASSLTNGHRNRPSDRSVLEGQPARTSRSATATDNGFGRTISRKSLDMAIKHMDIRQNLGGISRYWDIRQPQPAHIQQLPERCYALSLSYPLMVVGTADRNIIVYNLQNPQAEFKRIVSPLKLQTRCLAAFPDQQGFLVGSIEGRVGVHHVDDSQAQQSKNFTFKCHREGNEIYSVNSLNFHPVYGTFATSGSDGGFHFWDKDSKQRLKAFSKCPAPISCSTFNKDGSIFAYAVCYDWSKGAEKHNPSAKTNIFIHSVQEADVKGKPRAAKK